MRKLSGKVRCHHMPDKLGIDHRLLTVKVCCLVLVLSIPWAGCVGDQPETKPIAPKPHKLTDITVKGSTPVSIFTPTAFSESESVPVHSLPGDKAEKPEAEKRLPPVKTESPEKTTKKTGDAAPPSLPQEGEFTIQVGAYIIDDNLIFMREKVTSLGFSPYIKEMKQKMKMFCVIMEKGISEKKAQEVVGALSSKGFNPRMLPGSGGSFDVAAGIFYYRGDAETASKKATELGYSPRIEERAVEVILKQLRIGDYKTVDEARKDLTVLENKGLSPVILRVDQ